jgi:hypothetical protein
MSCLSERVAAERAAGQAEVAAPMQGQQMVKVALAQQ